MDKITEHSPKRLIVIDAVDAIAQELFGEKYEYDMVVSLYDSLENFQELEKPKWTTVLGVESSEMFDNGGTIRNEVLVSVIVHAPVPSDNLAHAIHYLEDIEIMKHELIGVIIDHKGHSIYGDVQNEDAPAWASEHDMNSVANILRIVFHIVLRIDDDRN